MIRKWTLPKLKPGPISMGLLFTAAVMFMAAIWTRDERWAQSAAIFLIPGIISGIGWFCIRFGPYS